MSLSKKFAILFFFTAFVGSASLGIAFVFGVLLEEELVQPFEMSTSVLQSLSTLEESIDQFEYSLINSGVEVTGAELRQSATSAPSESLHSSSHIPLTDRTSMTANGERLAEALISLRAVAGIETSIGTATVRNLQDRSEQARSLAAQWSVSNDQAVGQSAVAALMDLRELIGLVKKRTLVNADVALRHGSAMRSLHRFILTTGMVTVLLLGVLSAMLLRRWIGTPIRELRIAAVELGRGNLDHRITIRTHDELGALSTEVNQMAQTIATMQEEAVQRERLAAIGEMLRRVAHNIRNPLAGIRNTAELTRRRADDNSPIQADQKEIIQAVDRFNAWLSQLLEASAPLAIQPKPMLIAPWLDHLVDSQRPLARLRQVSIELNADGAPAEVDGDARHLEQAIASIVSNAIQASPLGGEVRIIVDQAVSSDHWRVCIEDDGPGIPESLALEVFRPYFTTKRDGNGIGLAVSKEVIRQHSGNVNVEASKTGGARFVCEFPMKLGDSGVMAGSSRLAEGSRVGG